MASKKIHLGVNYILVSDVIAAAKGLVEDNELLPHTLREKTDWRCVPLSMGNLSEHGDASEGGGWGTNEGYGLFMVTSPRSKKVRILAGCRDFSFAEAVKHWSTKEGRARRPHFLPLLKAAKEIAKQNGWRL